MKRLNNIYSTQDIHSFKRIKVPVKKHGLLKEILDDDANRRRTSKRGKPSKRHAGGADSSVDSIVRLDHDEAIHAGDFETKDFETAPSRLDPSTENGEYNDGGAMPSSAYRDSSPISPTCRYGIKDLENLFPNRDISGSG